MCADVFLGASYVGITVLMYVAFVISITAVRFFSSLSVSSGLQFRRPDNYLFGLSSSRFCTIDHLRMPLGFLLRSPFAIP